MTWSITNVRAYMIVVFLCDAADAGYYQYGQFCYVALVCRYITTQFSRLLIIFLSR